MLTKPIHSPLTALGAEWRVNGIAVKASAGADEIYLTGATEGAVDDGAAATVQDAFVMKLDNTWTEVWADQQHGAVD